MLIPGLLLLLLLLLLLVGLVKAVAVFILGGTQ